MGRVLIIRTWDDESSQGEREGGSAQERVLLVKIVVHKKGKEEKRGKINGKKWVEF